MINNKRKPAIQRIIGWMYTCQRCGHSWQGRKTGDDVQHPKQCPACKQTGWRKPAKKSLMRKTQGEK